MLHVEEAIAFWLGVPLALLVAWAMVRLRHGDGLRRWVIGGLRALVFAALVLALAGVSWKREHDRVTVIGLLDVSGSVRRFANLPERMSTEEIAATTTIGYLREWFQLATKTKRPDDRFGLIVFDGRSTVVSAPTSGRTSDDQLDVTTLEGTNIAEAIRLGLAMLPPDTAGRLVLVSDGVETLGDAMEEARASAGTPIDVAPIEYEASGDVQVVRVEAPPTAQPGQTVTVRVLIESAGAATGRLSLFREGRQVDLDPETNQLSRRVSVPAGASVQTATLVIGDLPVERLTAYFEPEDAAGDALPDNNSAGAVVVVPGRGAVLLVRGDDSPDVLSGMLDAAELPTTTIVPAEFPIDRVALQPYDLIILENVARSELSEESARHLVDAVHDFGAGLIMTGGDKALGVGGWNESSIESILPVDLDVPKELRLPSAALALVLDKSGSMRAGVGGALASQQEVANEAAGLAIESLQKQSYVSVVAFDEEAYTIVPLQLNEDSKPIVEKVKSIAPDGGTNIAAGLREGLNALKGAPEKVTRKHLVLLSDGRSDRGAIEEQMVRLKPEGVTLTTIAVGDQADEEGLKAMAAAGGGEFHAVKNPRMLPRVLVDSVRVINQPLIREMDFVPRASAGAMSVVSAAQSAPPLRGLVLTAPKRGSAAVIDLSGPEDEPVLAHWQAGVGRAAVFTSSLQGKWAEGWRSWEEFGAFWIGLARSMSRPRMSDRFDLLVTVENDVLRMEALSVEKSDESLLGLTMIATVYGPSGSAREVRLRQSAPGRFVGEMTAQEAGSYVAAVTPRQGDRMMTPLIGAGTRPTGVEYRRYISNGERIREIASSTGGRVLEIARPSSADVFERSTLPKTVSLLPAWRILLWVALGLLLLDVAARRLAWSGRGLLLIIRGMGERASAPSKSRTAEVVSGMAGRKVEARGGAELSIPQGPEAGPLGIAARAAYVKAQSAEGASQATAPAKPAGPDARSVEAGLAALLGAPKPPERRPEAEKPAAPAEEGLDAGGLLEAKRRARERFGR